MSISGPTYERVALEDPDSKWELFRGVLRRKPPMTQAHNEASIRIAAALLRQLDPHAFRVRNDAGRVRTATDSYYIPDVFVFPAEHADTVRGRTDILEVYDQPLPLVVEVWSPSTGDYDQREKLEGYRRRGDAEIWLVHPFERTVTRWVRGGDGGYVEQQQTAGTVTCSALPGVAVDFDAIFALL